MCLSIKKIVERVGKFHKNYIG